MKKRIAVLDLGTNTFHLQIAQIENGFHKNLYKEKLAVMLGKGGISNGFITDDAQARAIEALKYFRRQSDIFKVEKVMAIATSAFRNAKNGVDLSNKIFELTGIEIQIISGEEEAALIYDGVSLCVPDLAQKHLVVDIGGGSVEFIIGQDGKMLWKKSLEIGGQRLLDKFHQTDPIPTTSLEALSKYLNEELSEVYDAIDRFAPRVLVGSSGSFDTLDEIYRKQSDLEFDIESVTQDHLPVRKFHEIYQLLLKMSKAQRLTVPGMIPLRADMIVVACCLIEKLVLAMQSEEIVVSTCSLKEGIIKRQLNCK